MAKHHQYFVYILKCNDDTYYTGVTNDVERRLIEHQSGENKDAYTHSRRPVELVFSADFSNIEVAIEKEKQIKKWSKKKKEALINGEFELLPNLSKKEFKK
jgi:putative endonuclease